MSKNIIIGVIIGFAIGGASGYLFAQTDTHEQSTPTPSVQKTTTNTPAATEMKTDHQMHNVNYSETNVTPKILTIKAGDMVTWMNGSKGELMVAFGEHGNHDEYPDGKVHPTIEAGATVTITFPKAGTFDYHDHHNEEVGGTIIVN